MDRNRLLMVAMTALCLLSLVTNVIALRRVRDIATALKDRPAPAASAPPAAPVAVPRASDPAESPAHAPAYPAPPASFTPPSLSEDPTAPDAQPSLQPVMAAIAELRRDID